MLAYPESLQVISLPLVLDKTLPHCTPHCEEGATSIALVDVMRRAYRRRRKTGTSNRMTTIEGGIVTTGQTSE